MGGWYTTSTILPSLPRCAQVQRQNHWTPSTGRPVVLAAIDQTGHARKEAASSDPENRGGIGHSDGVCRLAPIA